MTTAIVGSHERVARDRVHLPGRVGSLLALALALAGLLVGDAGARYGVSVDTFVEQAKLTSADGAPGDQVGSSVAVSDNIVVVGVPADAVTGNNQGSVRVFQKSAGTWTERAKLVASDGSAGDLLGWSVAISGTTVVAGAPGDTVSTNVGQGSVYVFQRPAGGWADTTEKAKLTSSDGSPGDRLGSSVAVSGNVVVAGAPTEPVHENFQGAVYVFQKPGSGWVDATQRAKLVASDGTAGDQLGYSVAVSGNVVAAGAPFEAVSENNQGAVYLFQRPSSGWANGEERAKLTASDGTAGDQLGWSVAATGTIVVAGAPTDFVDGDGNQGSVYLFQKPGSGWATGVERAKLTASDGGPGDQLGFSVAAYGSTVVAGAPFEAVTENNQGAVYVLQKPGSGWASGTESAKLSASDGTAGDQFGWSVAVAGSTVVAGAPNEFVGGNGGQGAAYVFRRTG